VVLQGGGGGMSRRCRAVRGERMRPSTIARRLMRRLRWGNRKVSSCNGRSYIQHRSASEAGQAAMAAALEAALSGQGGVGWVRVNGALQRVVVAHGPDVELERLVEVVEAVEGAHGLSGSPLDDEAPSCPGDEEPYWRAVVEIGANALGLLTGVGLRAARIDPASWEVDLAAVLQVLEGIPQVRHALEGQLGRAGADLAFSLANALVSALLEGFVGPAADVIRRSLRLRTVLAQRERWRSQEADLGASPAGHAPQPDRTAARPVPIPAGPIERYTDKAVSMAMGGFGVAALSTGSLERATAMIFGGIPKPAQLGREGFVDQLVWRLTERGVVVLAPRRLKLLDRVDAVVVQGELLASPGEMIGEVVALSAEREVLMVQVLALFDGESPAATRRANGWTLSRVEEAGEAAQAAVEATWADGAPGRVLALRGPDGRLAALVCTEPVVLPAVETFLGVVLAAKLALYVADDGHGWAGRVEGVQRISAEPAWVERTVRALQAEGRTVLVVGQGAWSPLQSADVGLGLAVEGETPWEGHLIGTGGLADATFLLASVPAAARASKQAVILSMAEAGTGVLLSLGGLRRATTRSVMLASQAVSLVSMANGVRLAHGVKVRRVHHRDPTPWHALDVDAVLGRLGTAVGGLTEAEAEARRVTQAAAPTRSQVFRAMVLEELINPLAPILAAGAGLSALVGSVTDSGLITFVVGINALIGGMQRFRAKEAVDALDDGERSRNRVYRQGGVREVEPQELVVGDVITLDAGDVVPADCRILESHGLEVDESALTGESLPVRKSVQPCYASAVAERTSMLYEGTTVAAGEVRAVVVALGTATESHRWEPDGDELRSSAGVEARLETLTGMTAPVVALSGALVILMGMLRGRPSNEVISAGVSLAMAAVPEGLPLLATMAQLSAARRLSARGMLVRNPRAIEALGRVDLLCADKTGTLTEGRIQLRWVSDGAQTQGADALDGPARAILGAALRATPDAGGEPLPHATDQAFIEGGVAAGVTALDGEPGWVRTHELHFEPARGYHATLGRNAGDGALISVKGAPEAVLPRCVAWRQAGGTTPLDASGRAALEAHTEALASQGLRVLAVAERAFDKGPRKVRPEHVHDLVFVGFVTLADPPRASARGAIEKLRRAGVDVMMITGDHPTTARAIARELGLASDHGVLTGPELDALSEEALAARLPQVSVIARATPSHKVRIVRALQKAGRVVGMTGDGANDAPAIRMADAGIALGERSTAAARHAASLLVTDGRIETIVEAVLEGRALWASVRDAVAILVGGNLGEIIFTVLTALVEGRSALNARQLLLVNLLTDGLPALSIALRPPADVTPEQLMQEGPERSLGEALNRDIAWRAALTAFSAGSAWMVARLTMPPRCADTVALLALVGGQLGQTLVLGARSPLVLASSLGSLAILVAIVQTPVLSQFFGCQPLGPVGLTQAGIATSLTALAGVALPPLVKRLAPQLEEHPAVVRVLHGRWFEAAKQAGEALMAQAL